MSEFTNTRKNRLSKLKEVSHLILETGNAHTFIVNNQDFIPTVVPEDFITLFDELINEGHRIEDMKMLTNKILNIFHVTIADFNSIEPEKGSFLWVLKQNNMEMAGILDKIRPVFKAFVKDDENPRLKTALISLFNELEVFAKHYTIKENVLFPVIEKSWPDYRCLQIMWSFHDDIRRNIKTVLNQLSQNAVDRKIFNRCVGDIFFNMLAIKFREEHILFPYILSTISEEKLSGMTYEGFELGYPFIQPDKSNFEEMHTKQDAGLADLGTGSLSLEQIKLVFNHLPVDITYVDENDEVRYFSTPPKRIFPRTNAIIGRKVSNCHPPESVHVVEKIVESFRNGEKEHADFWIRMKGEYILIRYFAVRDGNGNYRGVIEVSQEISDIKALEGEKRLLDW